MKKINDNFRQTCKNALQQSFPVVITLKESYQGMDPQQLGIEAEAIAGLPGILKGTLTGESILELSVRTEVDEISEDFEVEGH